MPIDTGSIHAVHYEWPLEGAGDKEAKMQNQRTHLVFLFACTVALTILLGSAVHATPLFPWETENSVRAALAQQEGQNVVCEASVAKIAARNNPPYFVLRDEFRASNEPESRIVVLCRPPLNLTGTVRVTGVLGRLPNNELYITNPTVEGLFDQDGQPVCWMPFPGFAAGNWQVLSSPASVIPPSDESMAAGGIPDEVTAYATEETTKFDTVAALIASPPAILSHVELAAKPILSVNAAEGYIIVGDDASPFAVRVYTNASNIRLGDRIIRLSGTVHSQNGQTVLFAGNGILPYFDPTGRDGGGGTFIASPGGAAYASSLADASHMAPNGGVSIMSVNPPTSGNGDWVYLTGRLVTGQGVYYTGDTPSSSTTNVYYIQGFDRLSGIRVWLPEDTYVNVGDVVDIMAQVATQDGERMLGIVDTPSSVERVNWDTGSETCNLAPVFMNHKALGGGQLGNNPSVTDGVGLYNIGSRVRVCGKVVGKGYCSSYWWYPDAPYLQIDDGSQVPWDQAFLEGLWTGGYGGDPNVASATGVLVLDPPNAYDINIDDYVAVSGISSLWLTGEAGSSYRTVRFPNDVKVISGSTPSGSVTNTGDIPISVTVYGAANQNYNVKVTTNTGVSWTPTVTCNSSGVGTFTSTWEDVASELDTDGDTYGDTWPNYSVSAQLEDFKTRTASSLTPGSSTVSLYLVPLRKIYPASAGSYHLTACPGNNSTAISTVVRDADHQPIANQTVKFWTDRATFASDGSEQHVTTATTNSSGVAQTTLYAGYPSGDQSANVMVTDDLNTPLPNNYWDPYIDGKPYDWEALGNENGDPYGQNYISIARYQPTLTVTPANDPAIKIKRCEDLTVTANVQACGSGAAGAQIRFQISGNGTINEGSGSQDYTATANSNGTAVVHIHPSTLADPTQAENGYLYVSATSHGVSTSSEYRTIEVAPYSPVVTMSANPMRINGPGDVTISFTATNLDGTPRSSLSMTVGATANGSPIGTFTGYANNPTSATITNGVLNMTLHLTQPDDPIIVTCTFNDDCAVVGSRTLTKTIHYVERTPWIQTSGTGIGVGWSCPLVADLIPGGDGKPEVAIIARNTVDYSSETYSGTTNGKLYVWGADGTQKWVSTDQIDTTGNNTPSAADIDNRADAGNPTHLEITAPATGQYNNKMYAYGYDPVAQTFKPMAGWPASTPQYEFHKIAAALGDANLDGTTKIVAADYCCYEMCWNACGGTNQPLWKQITGGALVSVENSSVALGDTNDAQDASDMPDAIVGAETVSNVWSFSGNEWRDFTTNYYNGNPYRLTANLSQPQNTDAQKAMCSPVIGRIDGDTYNDIAVGDEDGGMWIYTSSDSTWRRYAMANSDPSQYRGIKSSPAIANLDGQPCVIFGCNNGRVYAIHSNGTSAAGWSGGILLKSGTRYDPEGGFMPPPFGGGSETPYSVRTSPLVGNVVSSTTDPQVIVGCLDGKVYALWKDGANHAGGAVAKSWQCAQFPGTDSTNTAILSTPTLCSLDGTHLDMIVASTDGIYKIHFDGTGGNANITYDSSNWTRWPWRTFHYDNARTGSTTAISSTKVSASIVGRVTSGGNGVTGASVKVQYSTNGTNWYDDTSVYGRTETRNATITTAGSGADELNKGGFVFNQLTPGRRYRLIVNGTTTVNVNGTSNLPAGLKVIPDIQL